MTQRVIKVLITIKRFIKTTQNICGHIVCNVDKKQTKIYNVTYIENFNNLLFEIESRRLRGKKWGYLHI